jgi:hypothetical protein
MSLRRVARGGVPSPANSISDHDFSKVSQVLAAQPALNGLSSGADALFSPPPVWKTDL